MAITKHFLLSTLNTVKNHIAVINVDFKILYVNQAWSDFASTNGSDTENWIGQLYLNKNDSSEESQQIIAGITQLKANKISAFSLEYPCHSNTEQRWFSMEINKFCLDNELYFVISHQNITQRVILENELRKQAYIDGLTGIANHRAFYEFITPLWTKLQQANQPLALAILDIDDFKKINDTYGHTVGDYCLKRLALVLNNYAARDTDICARCGGEEFFIVWGNANIRKAHILAKKLLVDINAIPVIDTNQPEYLKASIGLSVAIPTGQSIEKFISFTDRLMYTAKNTGKNRIVAEPFPNK